jgi:hypothetical protein
MQSRSVPYPRTEIRRPESSPSTSWRVVALKVCQVWRFIHQQLARVLDKLIKRRDLAVLRLPSSASTRIEDAHSSSAIVGPVPVQLLVSDKTGEEEGKQLERCRQERW